MWAAVTQNIRALRYASEGLKDDRAFMLEVVTSYGKSEPAASAFPFVSARLKADRDFVLEAVRVNGYVFESVSEKLRDDREIVLTAVRNLACAIIFAYASATLRRDRDFVLEVVGKNPGVLQYVSSELRNDKEIVLAALRAGVRQNINMASFVSRLMLDTDWLMLDTEFIARGVREVYRQVNLD